MGKKLIITEKPSVARDFARVFNVTRKHDGYIDNDEYIITWCVGHLVEMVYPEEYDIKYKKWRIEDLPFLPEHYKYDVIKNVREQYKLVNGFLNSPDVDVVYWAGDSGKEGQTIEENIRHFGGVRPGMTELRVWIDSQTDDEIRRGVAEAGPMSDYANLGRSGVMRAIEDYALGINFSRALSVKYGTMINKAASTKSYTAIAVGRVMTCVLGMVVNREREIRNFVETPFCRVIAGFAGEGIEAEWHVDEKSKYFGSPVLYKDNGFKEEKEARALIAYLGGRDNSGQVPGTETDSPVPDTETDSIVPGIEMDSPVSGTETDSQMSGTEMYAGMEGRTGTVESVEKSKSRKKPPFLFNLAELQAECSKLFKLSPDETLNVAQALYERKMTTYPRTDARVLTTAVAKEITKNLNGLKGFTPASQAVEKILSEGMYKGIGKSQYTDDSKVTDHYAIIPTGVTGGFGGLNDIQKKVYGLIVRRFLSIFYPPAEYLQIKISVRIKTELFTSSVRMLTSPGYLEVAGNGRGDKADAGGRQDRNGRSPDGADANGSPEGDDETVTVRQSTVDALSRLKKGSQITPSSYDIKPGRTSPPKRYTSGTMILAMENAGSLIDDEELRAQIKNCGIGTSATRAEIIKKLVKNVYINLNKKTQVLTPSGLGEMIYEVVRLTEPSLLNPQMSASWEKGLDEITRGIVDVKTYRTKLEEYIRNGTLNIAGKDLTVQIAKEIEKLTGDAGLVQMTRRSLGIACPVCGGELTTTSFGYGCSNYRSKEKPCGFSVGKIAGVRLGEEDIKDLAVKGKTGKIRGFKSKTGRNFEAALRLEKNESGGYKVVFDFGDDRRQTQNGGNPGSSPAGNPNSRPACSPNSRPPGSPNSRPACSPNSRPACSPNSSPAGDPNSRPACSPYNSAPDSSAGTDSQNAHPRLHIEDMRCPICGGRMKRTESGFACENHRKRGGNGADDNTAGGCILSIGSIMGRTLTEQDVCELITGGATPVIRGFESDRGETFDARIGFKTSPEGHIIGMRFIKV